MLPLPDLTFLGPTMVQIVHSVVVTNAMSAAVNVQVSVAVQGWKTDSVCCMNDHDRSIALGRCTGMTPGWACRAGRFSAVLQAGGSTAMETLRTHTF